MGSSKPATSQPGFWTYSHPQALCSGCSGPAAALVALQGMGFHTEIERITPCTATASPHPVLQQGWVQHCRLQPHSWSGTDPASTGEMNCSASLTYHPMLSNWFVMENAVWQCSHLSLVPPLCPRAA